jgi:protein Mpv17
MKRIQPVLLTLSQYKYKYSMIIFCSCIFLIIMFANNNVASVSVVTAFTTTTTTTTTSAAAGRVHGGVVTKDRLSSLFMLPNNTEPKKSFVTATASTATDTILVDEQRLLREEDYPIGFISQEVNAKIDINAILNTAIIVIIALGVLNQITTIDASIMRGWSVEETAIRIPLDIWNSYNSVLSTFPIQTKAITSGTVYFIGDFIAQRTEGSSISEIDRPRILRSSLAGLIGHGPLSHIWYNVSDELFTNILHLPTNIWGTGVKVAIDQTTWGPIWNNTYILLLGIMKFQKPKDIGAEMKRTTIPLLKSGLKLWPLAHCITYGLIPKENRLLWVDLVEIIWVTILATTAAGGSPDGTVEGTETASNDGVISDNKKTMST